MNPSLPHPSSSSLARPNFGDNRILRRSTVSWGAIFAGTSAALALQVLLMMLASGLGLAIFSPLTEENPVVNLSIGALLIQSLCAITSLCLGGWVAGRFTPIGARATAWLHGFSVWCVATVGGVLLVALGAGLMLGGLSSLVGGGLSAIGQPVAAVAGSGVDLAADAVKQSGDTITSFVDEAVSDLSEDGPTNEGIRAKREIGLAVARLFNPAHEGNSTTRRAAAVTALVEHADMSQSEADRTITEWTDTFEQLQADLEAIKKAAEAKAREAADIVAGALATFSLFAFFGFLIAAIAAAWGGHLGAACAMRCEETADGQTYIPAQES